MEAKLTGRALAALHNWHFTKVSKIENGAQNPSADDITAWCNSCNANHEIPDLVATARVIESMYIEWQRHMRAGLKRTQSSSVPLYERTRLFRGYENTFLPGLFHTAQYATEILEFWNRFLDLSSNIDEAVETRMERQRILYTGTRRFSFVLEEQTLHTRVGGVDTMVGQLDRLLAVMSLARVSLGIIPTGAPRHCLAQGRFWIFDEERVQTEGISSGLDITQPREIVVHVNAFDLLRQSVVYGRAAGTLIREAIARLQSPSEHPSK